MVKQVNILFLSNLKKLTIFKNINTIFYISKKNYILNFLYNKYLIIFNELPIKKTILLILQQSYQYLLYKPTIKQFECFLQIKKNEILNNFLFLKLNKFYQFWQLSDIFVYDTPGKLNRFTLIYGLISLQYNFRMYASIKTNEINPIQSITSLYSSAYWIEREIWDMFGILFINHNDLRRILTDYNFNGHPLRKDFPLSGFTDIFYDEKEKRLLYTSIELSQEYRSFTFNSVW
jgi:NADH-quinone oxidoreductase subunit C